MQKILMLYFKRFLIIPTTLITISFNINIGSAQLKNKLYSPLPLSQFTEITDKLSITDIPTGQGGFARDYAIKLKKGDNIAIDLSSENFDSIITLLGPDGSTIVENDDGPDGTSNSLLFTRIIETGNYTIRVRSFGETGVGTFKLKLTKLYPVK